MGESGNIRFLEPGEVQAILEAPSLRSLTGLRNRCIMGIMYEAGLRISEALALKPRDVSLEDKRVEVLEQTLEEARANAKWSWRRRMKKAGEGNEEG